MNDTTRKPEGQVPAGTLITLPLFTDTIPAVVISSTPSTITYDRLRPNPANKTSDGNPLPVIRTECDGTEARIGKPKTRRLRKDGTYRDGNGMPPIIFGLAVERVDYKV